MTENTRKEFIQEREFTENLLNQRFNFFLVFFSLVVVGALSANSQESAKAVLWLGLLVSLLLALTIFRVQVKFDLLFKELPDDHPAKTVDKKSPVWLWQNEPDGGRRGLGSTRRIIGYVIPILCVIALVAMLSGKLPVLSKQQSPLAELQLLDGTKVFVYDPQAIPLFTQQRVQQSPAAKPAGVQNSTLQKTEGKEKPR